MKHQLGNGDLWFVTFLAMALFATGFWLWMFFDVLINQKKDKLLWFLVVCFFSFFGSMLYYFIARKKRVAVRGA
ncbi:MAG: PLDc N-terminal domain-containing protein [Nitrospiria bacterium]